MGQSSRKVYAVPRNHGQFRGFLVEPAAWRTSLVSVAAAKTFPVCRRPSLYEKGAALFTAGSRMFLDVRAPCGTLAQIKELHVRVQQSVGTRQETIAKSMAKALIFRIDEVAAFFEKLFHCILHCEVCSGHVERYGNVISSRLFFPEKDKS